VRVGAPLLLVGLVGCTGEPPTTGFPPGPCESAVARVEVAPPDGDFGDLADGDALWCGNPPQGGAPYTPFRLRIGGPEGWEDGVEIEMSAVDLASGEDLAWTSLTLGLACANVGESAGMWVGSEAHMRYNGWNLDELEGREAEVTVRATALADPTLWAEQVFDVVLTAQ
jgi:hypothetical protein